MSKRAIRTNAVIRKKQILASAIQVATKIGYGNITRLKVARAAKVSPSLVSKYFGSMDSLRNKIVKLALKREILPIVAQIYLNSPWLVNHALRKTMMAHLSSR